MISPIYIIIFFSYVYSFKIKNISSEKWKSINNLIKNKNLTPLMRESINNIIYNSYENYALNIAYKFKKRYKYACKNIRLDELMLYSKMGLYKGILKYNGSYGFINYVSKYINGELYKGITDLYPLSTIPKHLRRKTKVKKELITQFVSYDNFWIFDKYDKNKKSEKIIYSEYGVKILRIKEDLDIFSKKVFDYKYNKEMEEIRSNKKIGELMECSSENIRKSLIKIKNKIKKEVL